MVSGLPFKLAQIRHRFTFSNYPAGRGNDFIEAGRHDEWEQLYGKAVEPLVIGSQTEGQKIFGSTAHDSNLFSRVPEITIARILSP